MTTTEDLKSMPLSKIIEATKLAAAIWAAEFNSTEKAFYRLRSDIRNIRVAKAVDTLKLL